MARRVLEQGVARQDRFGNRQHACMQAKKAAKQRKKVVHLDSDADSMSLDDNSGDSDFDGAPKKVRLACPSQTTCIVPVYAECHST